MSATAVSRPAAPSSPATLPVRKPRRTANWGSVDIKLAHGASTSRFIDQSAIEFWHIDLTLDYSTNRSGPQPHPALIARCSLVRVKLSRCDDLYLDLDEISQDLADIGTAIEESIDKLINYNIHTGANSSILIAYDVVVDPFWRGRRIGPALLAVASDLLNVDATFLTPFGLMTRLHADGEVMSDYYLPRPGQEVQAKVKQAWRAAGFRRLRSGVVWQYHDAFDAPIFNKRTEDARELLATLGGQVDNAATRAWWWRRTDRQLRHTAKLAQALQTERWGASADGHHTGNEGTPVIVRG
ncbi:MAG: hypothetical protein WCK14_14435 [Actinomycetota bacterium]